MTLQCFKPITNRGLAQQLVKLERDVVLRTARIHLSGLVGIATFMPRLVTGLQHAMTSSEERTSAEAEGYCIERSLMDCVAPPSKGGDAIHQ